MASFKVTYLKPFTLALVIVVLFQCCKVYYKEPSTIDQAIGPDKKRVKVIMNDDRAWIFDRIYYKNDELFGLLDLPKGTEKSYEVKLNQDNIQGIYLLNKGKSTTLSVLLGVGVFGAVIGIMYIIAMNSPLGPGL